MPSESLIAKYRDAALALLPSGRAFSHEPDSNIGKFFEGMSVEWARLDEAGQGLLNAANPSDPGADYIADWENAVATPGPCVIAPATAYAARAGGVVAKLLSRTSHSEQTFRDAAAALGFSSALTLVRHAPLSCIGTCVGALYAEAWVWYVEIHVPPSASTAQQELRCIFADELRRSHGFVNVIFD